MIVRQLVAVVVDPENVEHIAGRVGGNVRLEDHHFRLPEGLHEICKEQSGFKYQRADSEASHPTSGSNARQDSAAHVCSGDPGPPQVYIYDLQPLEDFNEE